MLLTALALTALPIPILATIYPTRFNGTTWDDTTWTLTTTALDAHHYQSRASLANGYLGINLAAVGPFFDVDVPVNGDNIQGWPLFDRRQSFATISGFWDSQPTTNGTNFEWLNQYGGESVISGVPHWGGLVLRVGDSVLDASVDGDEIADFSSSLDVRRGVMFWNYTWTPEGFEGGIDVRYTLFVHKLLVNTAVVRVELTARETDVNVTVVDLLEGDCAVRTEFAGKGYYDAWAMIWSAVRPAGLGNVTAYIASALVGDESCDTASRVQVQEDELPGGSGNASTIAQAVTVALTAGRTSTVTKYVGGASSDAFEMPHSTALNASWTGANAGFEALFRSHVDEWRTVMPADSVDSFRDVNGSLPFDENVQELQITAITNPFQLLQNTISENAFIAAGNNTRLQTNSISVCGLGGSCYAGLVFWDTEVWMQPGLVVAFPEAAKQIAQYRVKLYPQAQANIDTAYQSSQNETGKFSDAAAAYPWTSGRFGNCTGTGPCFDYQYHLNGDIGLEFYNYWTVTGDTEFFQGELFPIYESIANLYAELVDFNETTGLYELYNGTDPDEYANFQNNVGFTMVLMSSHLNSTNDLRERFGMEANATWTNISSHITIPVNNDANIILEYATQNGSITVKQADIVLIDDFLQFPNPYTLSNLDYYASAQSPDGPAMTYGVFSIIANRESPSGCSSYTYDLYGSQPYTRGPWFQFSEQLIDDWSVNGGTHPAFPFLTGVGGANRVAVFGYLGLRLNPDTLDIDPSLPPQIPQLEFRTIYWNGWPIKAYSNQTHTTLRRLGTPLSTANSTFANTSIPVTISLTGTEVLDLPINTTLTIPNRQIGTIKTTPGNLAQCRPITSPDPYEPGQFPLSAIDGAISTKWQPTQSNRTASITVSLPQPFVPITRITFDWAQAPPTSYRVAFHNLSDTSSVPPLNVTSSANVTVSDPFDEADQFIIRPYSSNTTNVTLEGVVWSARYATLEIEGNWATVGTENERNGTGATVAEWGIVARDGEDVVRRKGVGVWEG
ncbi:carbohydrate-binding module family 32 protein [Zasmidium cellare ATCC 36951]|uniref:alpha,alpha-trehalase n=1 Tax=Zasmidium cellare ATCC 36951 TaxID=1080233 RepID=A0A6A6CLN8_ZASCE|nr:carbohydrate-binding module family 32 protein [Zasmidium cellare ATCC 36951]KAF2167961.1 carbohydrate-binding module family 32 protein [Zasmidium cellare ATCC 36951]